MGRQRKWILWQINEIKVDNIEMYSTHNEGKSVVAT